MVWTLLAAMLIRSFLIGVFYVPSQSMMPTLLTGDYFATTRWDYGWSRRSSLLLVPFGDRRIAPATPAIGDVVVFSGVLDPRRTFVKRVMGRPGDVVEMRRGRLILNGRELRQRRVSEFVLPLGPNVFCLVIPGLIDLRSVTADGRPGCRFLRYVEYLPDGRGHQVLDFAFARSDSYGPRRVPADSLFMLGDNRDDSLDSRVETAAGGLGMVPMDRLLGRARYVVTSSDGTGSAFRPWSLVGEFRPGRIGAVR